MPPTSCACVANDSRAAASASRLRCDAECCSEERYWRTRSGLMSPPPPEEPASEERRDDARRRGRGEGGSEGVSEAREARRGGGDARATKLRVCEPESARARGPRDAPAARRATEAERKLRRGPDAKEVPTFSGDALVLMSPVNTFPAPLRKARHTQLAIANGSVRNSGAAGRNGDTAYVALELGERFLPRPTTTFTKRRLYCEGGKRGDEERQLKENVNPKNASMTVGASTLRRLMARPLGSFFLSCLATLGV